MIIKKNKAMPAEDELIPILVGITGHRDIENEQELIEHIKQVLLGICECYQASPVVLLTPLAEGADRAAAKAVIELRQNAIAKLNYMVILPMAEEEYKGTFTDKASIIEFDALKSLAIGCYQVPINETLELDRIVDIEKRHAKLYANMGTYIALNTQLLIAAWNGAEEQGVKPCKLQQEDTNVDKAYRPSCIADGAQCPFYEIKHGGTYHILRMRFLGLEEEYRGSESFLSSREFGPVYWIKAKRKSSDFLAVGAPIVGPVYPDFPIDNAIFDLYNSNSSSDVPGYCKRRVTDFFQRQESQANGNKTYEDILSKLNEYNRDINNNYSKLADKMSAAYKDFTTYFYKEGNEENFAFNHEENIFIAHYSKADALSLYYQKKRKIDICFLILLAFLGLLSFNLYSGPLASNWFIMSYSIIYLTGTLYYIWKVKANSYHEKYVDYRGVAEAIRVQFFWCLIGIRTRVSDKYLTKQKGSIDWIRIAVNNTLLLYESKVKNDNACWKYKDNISKAYKLWLLNQCNYYNRKYPQKEKTEKDQKLMEKTLFICGLVVAVVLSAVDTYEYLTLGTCGMNKMFLGFSSNSSYEFVHKWLVFTVGFLPVITAIVKVYTEFLAYSKLARNFKWMRMLYNISAHEFERIKNNYSSDQDVFIAKCRRLFYDIGIEALLENGEWIGIFEERAPEMPK